MNIEIGKVVGVWGVKGWIKIHSFTRERSDIEQYSPWLLANERVKAEQSAFGSFNVQECRRQGRGLVAKLVGVDAREQAEELIGSSIFIARSQLPDLAEGEYYWQDLIGLRVIDTQDRLLGHVKSMLETGANDVFVVKPETDVKQPDVLIPYVDDVILDVNLEEKTLRVDWDPAYLLE